LLAGSSECHTPDADVDERRREERGDKNSFTSGWLTKRETAFTADWGGLGNARGKEA